MKSPDLLVARFDRYFRHPDPRHDVLIQGDMALACCNLRAALEYLHLPSPAATDPTVLDAGLVQVVRKFQTDYHNRIVDGKVGPNTRRLLIRALLEKYDPLVFGRLTKEKADEAPSVFLSYAWKDRDKVNKVDQWLRNNGVSVLRDLRFFVAGKTIDENIRIAIGAADKIIAFYSADSRDRDWPRLERAIAEEVEQHLEGQRILIYVCLDDTPLPSNDLNRLAVKASGQPLRLVGGKILQALIGGGSSPTIAIPIDEDEPL
jgi:hypothetical protein